jgi:hypothetical protein
VSVSCKYGDEPSGSGATELVYLYSPVSFAVICILLFRQCYQVVCNQSSSKVDDRRQQISFF